MNHAKATAERKDRLFASFGAIEEPLVCKSCTRQVDDDLDHAGDAEVEISHIAGSKAPVEPFVKDESPLVVAEKARETLTIEVEEETSADPLSPRTSEKSSDKLEALAPSIPAVPTKVSKKASATQKHPLPASPVVKDSSIRKRHIEVLAPEASASTAPSEKKKEAAPKGYIFSLEKLAASLFVLMGCGYITVALYQVYCDLAKEEALTKKEQVLSGNNAALSSFSKGGTGTGTSTRGGPYELFAEKNKGVSSSPFAFNGATLLLGALAFASLVVLFVLFKKRVAFFK